MRALVTGGGGQLAADLIWALGDGAVARTREELDITDIEVIHQALEETAPDVVLNCAAFHNVEVCEREPDTAWAVNVRAVRDLATACRQRGVRLVHFSTNYVFDGRRAEPYAEDDLPAPRSVYALTKLAGEHAALGWCEEALVVRTAGLYGLQGSASKGGNFVQRMLARAHEQGELRMVADQRLQPTFTADLAAATADALAREATGVLHLVAGGACSWLEFTEAIMDIAAVDVPIEGVATTIPQGAADRPLNGVLASERADVLGLGPLRPWRDALEDYMRRAGLAALTRQSR